MSIRETGKHQDQHKVSEASGSGSSAARLFQSETQDAGLGARRMSESVKDSCSMQKEGLVGNLSINEGAPSSDRKGKIQDGGEMSIVNDPKASAEDKLRAAKNMADSGENGFTGSDGRKYKIHTQNYGDRTATVVSTSDDRGRFMPVLRGLVDQEGNVSRQKYQNGQNASFTGDRAAKVLKNSPVLKEQASSQDTGEKPGSSNFSSRESNNEAKKKEEQTPEGEQEEANSRDKPFDFSKSRGSNGQKTWDFLRQDLNLTKAQAAGVIGNLEQESHLNPNQHQLKGGPGFGLAQWEGSRKQSLEKFAQQHGSPRGALDIQLKFLKHELNTSEKSAFHALQRAKTVEEATLAFAKKFERAGRPNMPARYRFAKNAMARYGANEESFA